MDKKRDCKIVQDLLPSYIEKLTNEETNKYIEEHISTCEDCKKVLESMQNDLDLGNKKAEKVEVKYLKKYKNKLRIFEVILLLIVVIFLGNIARKMAILSSLSKKSESYATCTNYHRTVYGFEYGDYYKLAYGSDGSAFRKLDVYTLGNKKMVLSTRYSDEGTEIVRMLASKPEGEKDFIAEKFYAEKGENKTAYLDKNTPVYFELSSDIDIFYNINKPENLWDLFIVSLYTTVTLQEYHGKECYYISTPADRSIYGSMYIDKQTGLPLCTVGGIQDENTQLVTEYAYEFNTVTEDVFAEPDISEYEIIK